MPARISRHLKTAPLALRRLVPLLVALGLGAQPASGESTSALAEYFRHWGSRVEAARASQPQWISPIATSTARLGQEVRLEHYRQTLANGDTLELDGGGKGLSLMPAPRLQLTLPFPPYQRRRGTAAARGFADWAGPLLKYRLLSATEGAGNYVVSLIGQYGLPTGAAFFTNRNHVFTPTLAAGKGHGNFDVQATLGEAIPTRDHSRSGKAILSNVAFQYHLTRLLWPEFELNRTDWRGGLRAGRSQTYLTTGLVVGRLPLGHAVRFSFGVGYQTRISRVYRVGPATPGFNHSWLLSTRTAF